MRVSSTSILFASLVGGTIALGASLTACYNPSPKPGSFLCDFDAGGLCPSGLICNKAGVCEAPGAQGDMVFTEFDIAMPPDMSHGKRTCDQIVQAGAFSNLTELKSLNTAGDESHLAFDPVGKQLLFQRGSSLFASSLAGGYLSPAAPTALTIGGAPATLNGGSFTTDGHYWFSGTSGSSTSLYDGAPGGGTFTATLHTPTSTTCPFFDPAFVSQTPPSSTTNDLLVSFPLNGCSGASYVVRGAKDLNMGAFYSGLTTPGWQSASTTSSGLTLIVASTASASAKPQLYTSSRSDTIYQFNTPGALDMSAIGGPSTEDRQMILSDDCSVAYFISVRTGGTGGADIWAAELASK